MTIFSSVLPPVEIPAMSITQFLLRRVEDTPDRLALVDGVTGRSLTYSELRDAIFETAGGLRRRGFGQGDVLGIMAPNLPEYAVAFHAAALLGGAATTINPTYTAGEVRSQLVDSGAKLLVTVGMVLEVAKEAVAGTSVAEIFTFDHAAGSTPFSDLRGGESVVAQRPVDLHEDVAVLPYSSGTTGHSKGVILTHHNLVANLVQSDAIFNMDADNEVLVAVLPFFHIYGMQVLMNGALAYGGTVVTMPRFDLETFLGILEDHKVTRAYVVPPIVLALAKQQVVANYDLSALRIVLSGAAPLGAEVSAEAAERTGAQVIQGYGLTETSPITHATQVDHGKAGSIGYLTPMTEAMIVDPNSGDPCPVGVDGELWVRGPQVMKGYLNNAEATAGCIDSEGWLHTGDVAHVDEDHHYFIVDRLKELIKYKGFQVPPAELEALLVTHPAVADAAVIPVSDASDDEIPKALIVTKPNRTVTAEELMAFVADQVATYKQVRRVEFIDEIPKSASGKILRRILRDRETR